MSSARKDVLRTAGHTAAMMRRSGYPDARVMPEYCIAGEIGPDNIWTETICVYAGEYKPETIPQPIRDAYRKEMERLASES